MKTLFDTYSIALSNKSRRSILDVLDRELCRYAYVADNHITLSNIAGSSHTDAVIKSINSDSFVYIEGVTEDRSFLLVISENEILFSGMINDKDIETKLLLYKLRMTGDFKVHLYNRITSLSEEYVTNILDETFTDKIKSNVCQLIDIKDIKYKLNKPVLLLKIGLLIIAIIIASVFFFTNYENEQREKAQEQQAQQVVDTWHNYREALHQPAMDTSFDALNKSIRPLRTLGRTPLTHFSFKRRSLTAKLSDFSMPAMYFTSWAKNHHFRVTSVTPKEFDIRKTVSIKTERKNNIIFVAQDVEYKLMDDTKALNNKNISISFDQASQNSNYETIEFKLNISKEPMIYIQQLLHQYHRYPLQLDGVDGDLNRGLFTGTISAHIIGGLS